MKTKPRAWMQNAHHTGKHKFQS